MGTEDRRAYFAQELQKLSQQRQFVEVDESDNMEVFYDITESERHMTQTSCNMRWAPLTRHAVLNEELIDSDLIPELGQPIGSAVSNRICPEDNPREQLQSVHKMDNLRAEVSPLTREQDDTSLADRFSRGGLPFTVGHLHGGSAVQDNSPYAEAAEIKEDKLDETRNNEAHSRHVASPTESV